jgi:hypothetical protein
MSVQLGAGGTVLLGPDGTVATDPNCCCGECTCPEWPWYTCFDATITIGGNYYMAKCNSDCTCVEYEAVSVSGSINLTDCGDPLNGYVDGFFDLTVGGSCRANEQARFAAFLICDCTGVYGFTGWAINIVVLFPSITCCISPPDCILEGEYNCNDTFDDELPYTGYQESGIGFLPELNSYCLCCNGLFDPIDGPTGTFTGSGDLLQNYSGGPCQCPTIADCYDRILPCGCNPGADPEICPDPNPEDACDWTNVPAPGRPTASWSVTIT